MLKKMNLRTKLIISLFLIMSLYTDAIAKTIYVDDDATSANNGTSWENAYNFLQDALADANSSEKPVEIKVAQGIYTPDSNSVVPDGTGDREATFQLMNSVTLVGGYAGFEQADPNSRDIEVYETILSGDLHHNDAEVGDPCDLDNEPTRDDNSYNVVIAICVSRTAILDGFTIEGGNADGSDSNGCGSGMNISGTYLVRADPVVVNCRIRGNMAIFGGGIACDQYSSPTLTNCTFAGNTARIDGGGLWKFFTQHPLRLNNCTFISNYAGGSGGGVLDTGSTMISCTFIENRSDSTGGGIRCNGNSTLVDCSFIGNQAQGGFGSGHGGGLYYSGTGTLINCIFIGNRAFGISGRRRGTGSRGGGMFIYGAPDLINCVFVGNSSGRGGGMCCNSISFIALTNCTFSGNLAEGDNIHGNIHGGLGGGIYVDSPLGTLNNCILWGNRDSYGAGQSAQISNANGWIEFSARYCCIQDDNPDDGQVPSGKANIDDDPLFVRSPHDGGDGWGDDPLTANIDEGANDDYGNLRLRAGSPGIDAGDNKADTGANITASRLVGVDRENHVRMFDDPETEDTGNGQSPLVDMGAYEFASPSIPSRLFVDANATGANNGTSWTDAMNSLHLALRTAMAAAGPVSEIWVAFGRYSPYESERDRYDCTFRLLNGLAVYGGFPPGGGTWRERDSSVWEATLEWLLHGTKNIVYIVTSIDCDHTAILDGFTITGTGHREGSYKGAGMYNENSDPTISNCIFADNSLGSGSDDEGIGIHNLSSNPTLTNCVFRGNFRGVAVYSENSSPKFIGCTFERNWHWAVKNYRSAPVFTHCEFSHNDGMGAMKNEDSNVVLSNCAFTNNSASSCGGMLNLNSTVTLNTCTFARNSTIGDGGAIYNDDSDATLTNCILWGCTFPLISGAANITYSNIEGGWLGEGNINIDPLFANPDSGDYHLKSQAGRWDPDSESWMVDDVTSPCIDAGDPNSPVGDEPFPNGGIINMGAYGGTTEASKSPEN